MAGGVAFWKRSGVGLVPEVLPRSYTVVPNYHVHPYVHDMHRLLPGLTT